MKRSTEPTLGAIVGYALAGAPSMFGFFLILVMYMKYASVSLGVSTAVVGWIFLAAKMWNAVADPLIGTLSDRTRHRRGRRLPWLIGGGVLLVAFHWMAWVPPTAFSGTTLTLWIALAIFGFYTAYSSFEIPHMALGAEMSLEAGGRNRIFAVRQAILVVTMLVAGGIGTAVIENGREPTKMLLFVVTAVSVLLVFGGVATLPPERAEFQGRTHKNPFLAVRDVLRNRHARLLLLVIFIDSIGTGGIGTLTPFVIDYVVGDKSMTPILLVLNIVTTLASIPIWVWLTRRFEKRHLMLAAMIGSAVGFGTVLFASEGNWLVIALSAVVAGASLGCSNTIGYTLKAEIIDCDEYETGERKEGAYFAGWSFVRKLAAGLMLWLVGQSLELAGFDGQAARQNETVKTTMLVLMGGFPLVCYLVGAVFFARFSLSEAEHARIRRELDLRNAAVDPLPGSGSAT